MIDLASIDWGIYKKMKTIIPGAISKLQSLFILNLFDMRFIILLALGLLSAKSYSQDYYLFVGTYTSGKSFGIYVYQFNNNTGNAKLIDSVASQNPSYLAVSPSGNYVYAANEVSGAQGGEVSAYAFDKISGKLRFLNKQLSEGSSPCYVSISKDNKWLMVANYSSGTISALPLNTDGTIAPAAQTIAFKGCLLYTSDAADE